MRVPNDTSQMRVTEAPHNVTCAHVGGWRAKRKTATPIAR